MPYAIIATHKADAAELRTSIRPQHIAYLDERKILILAGGALLDDRGEQVGGMLIIDTEDPEAAMRFIEGDPYSRHGVIAELKVLCWRKSFFDGARSV